MNIDKEYLNDQDDFEDQLEDPNSEPTEIPKEVRTLRTQSYDKSLRDLVTMIDDTDIELDPDYQRNYLWDNKKSSLLIESILLNIPIPVIYVSENTEAQWSVIDGLQRLNSIYRYFKNEFKLSGLEILTELNGDSFHNLPPKAKRLLSNGMLRVVVLLAETHPEIKYDIFMRLNTGAVKLNEQELRNCLYRGALNEKIKEIRKNPDFLELLSLKKPHNRFADCEIILRYLAIYKSYNLNSRELDYPGKMKTFLNEFIEKNKNVRDQELETLHRTFDSCIDNIQTVLGKNAFRRPDTSGRFDSRINRALIDVIMICFSHLTKEQCTENQDLYRNAIKELCTKDKDFIEAITLGTSDTRRLKTRIEKGLQALGIA